MRFSDTKQVWKLLDLGLATDMTTRVCNNIGTDGYRAPEVAAKGVLTPKADVYGFGVMMADAFMVIEARMMPVVTLAQQIRERNAAAHSNKAGGSAHGQKHGRAAAAASKSRNSNNNEKSDCEDEEEEIEEVVLCNAGLIVRNNHGYLLNIKHCKIGIALISSSICSS